MKEKTVLGIMLTLILVGVLTSAVNIQPVKASGTIYIRADGSIDPPTVPISSVDNVTYTLTGNIISDSDGIVVERSNIIIDGNGYALQGLGNGIGISLLCIGESTMKNIGIQKFSIGIKPSSAGGLGIDTSNITNNGVGISSDMDTVISIVGSNVNNNGLGVNFAPMLGYISISESNISNNGDAISLRDCSFSITRNRITNNAGYGVFSLESSGDILENDITNNSMAGICSDMGYYDNIIENNITDNDCGLWLLSTFGDTIYHNNFINNTTQVYAEYFASNVWDDGAEGNYWDNYTESDLNNDGIGDTSHVINSDNTDYYPLMLPYKGHNVAVANVTINKTVVAQGTTQKIDVKTANDGSFPQTFSLTVYANDTETQTLAVSLAAGNSTTLRVYWDTAATPKGNYTIKAHAWPVLGETYTADNTLINGWIFVAMVGDVDASGKVDMIDLWEVARHFGTDYPDPRYEPNFDIDDNGKIDMIDIWITAKEFGKIDP